jgi:hypothetical protein
LASLPEPLLELPPLSDVGVEGEDDDSELELDEEDDDDFEDPRLSVL